MKKIGLVGGISWTSTLDYYKYINEGINQKLGGLESVECIIYSLNFADVQRKTWTNSFDLIYKACKSLISSGVDAIALCANTAHLFADEIQSKINVPIIHIVTNTAHAIKNQKLSRVALLGTKFTMEMNFYKKKLEENNIEVLIPKEKADIDTIQYIVKEELGKGLVVGESRKKMIQVSEQLIQRGAEGIVLGCTEIPMLIGKNDFTIPVFDTVKIHVDSIIDFVLDTKNSYL
ncbi:aspartate racemase [Aquimarina sp. MAR_2010_214]|uniref:aspartate/glutamate racemase family protein n=1 Tax=Aquimarina sp. MAR_2010_214 TaxID=1250026 RepID=UPI000C7013A5|nr:amino acid racemase [Aquimarina sp. MAR_2010_214]PKV51119.1 aspartate racemase [Aquimarina sp. MAR_2010_214]